MFSYIAFVMDDADLFVTLGISDSFPSAVCKEACSKELSSMWIETTDSQSSVPT